MKGGEEVLLSAAVQEEDATLEVVVLWNVKAMSSHPQYSRKFPSCSNSMPRNLPMSGPRKSLNLTVEVGSV